MAHEECDLASALFAFQRTDHGFERVAVAKRQPTGDESVRREECSKIREHYAFESHINRKRKQKTQQQ